MCSFLILRLTEVNKIHFFDLISLEFQWGVSCICDFSLDDAIFNKNCFLSYIHVPLNNKLQGNLVSEYQKKKNIHSFILRKGLLPSLAWNSVCRSAWLWNHRGLSTSILKALELKKCITTLCWSIFSIGAFGKAKEHLNLITAEYSEWIFSS